MSLAGGGGAPEIPLPDGGATEDPGTSPDTGSLLLDSNPNVNSIIRHGLGRLLLSLLLRIMPPKDTRSELADHGYKAEAKTPDSVLNSPEMLKLAVRPTQVPFANASVDPGNQGPRRTLRVSR